MPQLQFSQVQFGLSQPEAPDVVVSLLMHAMLVRGATGHRRFPRVGNDLAHMAVLALERVEC